MMHLRVHEVSQNAGGGSYVVIFDAEIHLRESGQITVEVCSTDPKDTEAELIEAARQGILRGVEHVLSPLSKGASVQVRRLVVNPVDFKPNRFTLHTALGLKKLMAE